MFDLDNEDQSAGRQPLFDAIFNQAGQAWTQRGYIGQPVSPSTAKDTAILQQIWESRNRVARLRDAMPAPPPNLCSLAGVATKRVTINFLTGKSDLDDKARQVIRDDVALQPRELANAYFCLEGNTDYVGNHATNVSLSKARAESVRMELINRFKLQENQLVSIGHGPDNPVCGAHTQDCLAKNRRTDVKVIPVDKAKQL